MSVSSHTDSFEGVVEETPTGGLSDPSLSQFWHRRKVLDIANKLHSYGPTSDRGCRVTIRWEKFFNRIYVNGLRALALVSAAALLNVDCQSALVRSGHARYIYDASLAGWESKGSDQRSRRKLTSKNAFAERKWQS
ncbi:hypothetical protein CPB86DRAFT_820977 [Serendipita vermifera]|nr:hypothetical protein CPB86DRAFT_820977 [Serendipita vermifera]